MKYNQVKFELSVDVIFNFISLVLMLFTLYYLKFAIDKNIAETINIFYIAIIIILQITTLFQLENCYFFVKTIQIGKKYLAITPCIICICGVCELIVQYITLNQLHHVMNTINSVITVPLIIFSLNYYLRNLNIKYKIIDAISNNVSWNFLRLYGIAALSFLCAHWASHERNNFSAASLLLNIIYEWLAMVVLLIQCTYMVMTLVYATDKKNKRQIKNPKYNVFFPYPFFIFGEIMIIIWGSVCMFSKSFILEESYLPTTAIYIGIYIFCSTYIHLKICKLRRIDFLCAILMISIILINYLLVNFISTNDIAGDFVAIVAEVFSLIIYVGSGWYAIKNMKNNP